MLRDKKCILYVYKGHLGLPSIDYKCLQALFVLQMKDHKVDIKSSGFYITPNFPMLEYDGQFYTTQTNIIKKLEEIVGNVNKNTNVKKSRIEAYKALSHQILEPCLILNFWANEKNCQFLMKMYGSEKYFPMRLIYLRRMNIYVQDRVSDYIHGIWNEVKDIEVNEMLESYFTDISHLLTLNKYLLGNTPSVLDAYVCGYLVPMYILNLPDKTLKLIIKRNDIVVKYIMSYLKYYNIKVMQEVTTGVQEQDENDRASLGLLATAGFVAMSLMIGYGIINDIFRLK